MSNDLATTAPTGTTTSAPAPSFFQGAVLNAFAAMKLGRLPLRQSPSSAGKCGL